MMVHRYCIEGESPSIALKPHLLVKDNGSVDTRVSSMNEGSVKDQQTMMLNEAS